MDMRMRASGRRSDEGTIGAEKIAKLKAIEVIEIEIEVQVTMAGAEKEAGGAGEGAVLVALMGAACGTASTRNLLPLASSTPTRCERSAMPTCKP
jgi:hypothetical protein